MVHAKDVGVESPYRHYKRENVASLMQAFIQQSPEVVAHCLRVHGICSQWGQFRRIDRDAFELLEGVAVLHDLARILPDSGNVESQEAEVADNLEAMLERAMDLLDASVASKEMKAIFFEYQQWLLSSDGKAKKLPRSEVCRLLAIADVYDSLTTGEVFGSSLHPNKALAELYRSAGTNFDADLVHDFAVFIASQEVDQTDARKQVGMSEWINAVVRDSGQLRLYPVYCVESRSRAYDDMFHRRLLDYMHHGVVCVNRSLKIIEWNRAAERLTGVLQIKTLDELWRPNLIGLMDEEGKPLTIDRCPLADTIEKGLQSLHRLKIKHRDGREIFVDAHFLPVRNSAEELCGATFMFGDASQSAHLEKRVQTLHEKATRDSLTQVANRAELDKQLIDFVNSCTSSKTKGCLIITDVDRFKRVNDEFGHQVGDEALKFFADILREHARKTDMVARYGGEEFVILCSDCDLEDAGKKAEKMRQVLQSRSLSCLKGKTLTASFGVTDVSITDNPERVLQRADEALMRAKGLGRNRVLLSSSSESKEEELTIISEQPIVKTSWLGWFSRQKQESLLKQDWLTSVPVDIVVEKLRGALLDFKAEVLSVEEEAIKFRIDSQNLVDLKRNSDRRFSFIVDVKLKEVEFVVNRSNNSDSNQTLVEVEILHNVTRDRRSTFYREQAELFSQSLQSYLIAQILDSSLRQRIRFKASR
jgi:diguanylate cyclase (GGDEF)-like protein/PAS domain S-box-containing protein